MKEFNFKKKGISFKFKNPELNEYNNLVLDWKIEKIKENKRDKDGYYYNANFDKNNKTITFSPVEINDNEIGGVGLPDDIYEELFAIYEKSVKERNGKIDSIVENIIAGKIPIDFGIVGCDYPHYQPWLYNISEDLKGLEQNIMKRAIYKYTQEEFIFDTACHYLEKKLNQDITTAENINKKAFNLKLTKETQEYHGYKETIVTGFQIKLSDVINIEEIKEKREKERKRIEEREKMKKSLDMIILKKGSDGDDYYAIVKLTEPNTKESLMFTCRNVFDGGYVINPAYEIEKGINGGLVIKGQWHAFDLEKALYPVRELTEFEKKCIDYLGKFPPINTNIRL